MTRAELESLPHRYAAALTAGDADAVADLFAVDAVQTDPYGSARRHGREAIRAFFEIPAAERSGRRFEIVEVHGTPEAVAFSFRFTPGPESEKTLGGIDVFELDPEGLIRVHVAYFGPDDWSPARISHPRRAGVTTPQPFPHTESTPMNTWTPDTLIRLSTTDDLHISPFRQDGVTYGTPTWIWSVVVDGNLYVRPWNGVNSRWYQAATTQHAGRITAAGEAFDVRFADADPTVNAAVDAAYNAKYAGSPYLPPMVSPRTRAATVVVTPA